MAQPVSKAGIVFNDFQGLVTNVGRIATPDNSSNAQINLMSIASGEMVSRPAMRRVEFDEDQPES